MDLRFYLEKGTLRAKRALTNASLYRASRLFQRRAGCWVFGSSFDKFDGNSKYLFLWVLMHHPEINATWITGSRETHDRLRDEGYPVAMRWSALGVRRTLRAKVAVFSDYSSDINVALLGGAKLVNLWHGVGIKGVEHLSTLGGPRSRILKQAYNPLARVAFLERFLPADLFLSTSPTMTAHFSECFRLPTQHILEAGYPRLDVSVAPELRDAATRTAQVDDAIAAMRSGKRVIVYMPTWRNTGRRFLESAFPDLARLDRALSEANAVLFLKLHHMTHEEQPTALSECANIRLLASGADPYVVFPDIACLITDYSSVLYDFLWIRSAGVVLYTFDEEDYFRMDQSMVAPFDENVVGARARSFEELCRAITTGEAFAALDPERLRGLRTKFWASSVSPASPKIVERLQALAATR